MLGTNRLIPVLLLSVLICGGGVYGQTTSCPAPSDLSPACSCGTDASGRVTLDCSGARDESQLEQIFTAASFPALNAFKLTIANNPDLKYLTRNVFGDVTFERLFFSDDAIEYIDETVFVNSNSTLQRWEMHRCNLIGSPGFPFYSLNLYSKLTYLNFDFAGNFEVLPRITSSSLTTLYVTNCLVQFVPNQALKDLPNLRLLSLAFNGIVALSSGTFDNNLLLEKIYLSNNNIGQLDDGTFKNLDQLTFLDLEDNKISQISAGSFYNLPKLEKLILQVNSLTNLLNDTLGYLPALRELHIGNNNIQLIEKALLIGCPVLEIVNADYMKLTSIEAGTFDALISGDLNLNHNLLTTLDESWLRTVLENENAVVITSNPLECGCDMAWLFANPLNMEYLTATCSNETDISTLDSSYFANSC